MVALPSCRVSHGLAPEERHGQNSDTYVDNYYCEVFSNIISVFLMQASPVKRNAARIDEPVRVVNDEEITSSSEDEQGLDDVPKKRTGKDYLSVGSRM